MKAKLSRDLKREPTISYPNPSRGYGLLDISTIINYKLVREVGDGKPEEKTTGDQWED